MSRGALGTNLVDEALVIFPPAPPRYTIVDCLFDARQKNRVSEDQQMLADRVLEESTRVIDETKFTTEKWKTESDYRLKERMVEIKFLLDEAMEQKKAALKEEEALKTYKQRILNAIKFLKNIAMICQKSIILRDNRRGVDMVGDEVDQEVKREIKVIQSCQAMIDKTLAEANEQIRRLRATIYLLDRDLSNKGKSYQIDEINLSLRTNQQQMSVYEGATPLVPYNTTNEEWILITTKGIQDAAKELNSAMTLRSYVDIILKQVTEDLSNQIGRTNESFLKKITETRYAKNVLEGIHCNTAQKINDMSRNITNLEKEIQEKEGFLALVQMRLANRAQRPGTELCRDKVQDTLSKELELLQSTVGNLNQMVAESKATLRYLLHTQMTQEEEINIKTNSLKIDEVDCMTIREGLNMTNF